MTSMKAWRMEEAARCGVSESAIAMRLKRGQYPVMGIERRSTRDVMVLFAGPTTARPKPRGQAKTPAEHQKARRGRLAAQGLTTRGTERVYRSNVSKIGKDAANRTLEAFNARQNLPTKTKRD